MDGVEQWTRAAVQANGSGNSARRRQRSWEVDVQRARALRGDALEELTDSQREWVWRSLLRGVRLAHATTLAQLSPEAAPQALQQVAHRYSALMEQRRHERQARRDRAGGMKGSNDRRPTAIRSDGWGVDGEEQSQSPRYGQRAVLPMQVSAMGAEP